MNKFIIKGNIAFIKAYEKHTFFTVAVENYAGSDDTSFIPVTAFLKTAEIVDKFFEIGMPILVEGRINVSGDDEERRVSFICDYVEFCERKSVKAKSEEKTGYKKKRYKRE